MIKEYLLEREKILKNIIRVNKEKFEHNQIAIVESNNQIKELNNTIDEASQIFSVKAREDNSFKRQEIIELESRIAAYVSENKEFEKVINSTEKELEIVNECFEEIRKDNVSRETLDENVDCKENIVGKKNDINSDIKRFHLTDACVNNQSEILDKLKLCKSIAEIDGKRVGIEIDNLIKMIEE